MNKINIMNQVTVYQGLFSDEELNLLVNEINKSEQVVHSEDYELKDIDPDNSAYLDKHGPQPEKRKDGSAIFTWAPWYTYGSRSIWGYPNGNEDVSNQAQGFRILTDAILKAHSDYVKDYAETGEWPYEISDWSIGDRDEHSVVLSTLEILRHKRNTDTKYTIGMHTDWHNHRADEPGPKQLLTYTIYLNDEYDGGEIDFIDESNKHLIAYKPKRGDITVFPSGRPYWHGARGVTSEASKLFIRTFAIYRHPMTEKWSEGVRLHGPTRFLEIENERLKTIVDSGIVGRQPVLEGTNPANGNSNPPIYYNRETYIDGRV